MSGVVTWGCQGIRGKQCRFTVFFSRRQVKKSTLNPNAKEFNPTKPLLSVVRGWEGVALVVSTEEIGSGEHWAVRQ